MNKAQQLRDKFDADLKALQADCPHTQSKWFEYMWAPGHFGLPVRCCLECDLILERTEWVDKGDFDVLPNVDELNARLLGNKENL